MSAEEILITHGGYTDTAWPTCGEPRCTGALLLTVGIDPELIDPQDVNEVNVGDTTYVTVGLLGEQDSCIWCYACGDFIQTGLSCEHENPDEDHRDLGRPCIEVEHSDHVKALHA